MPTRSPPFRVADRSALIPLMKMSLAFWVGSSSCSSNSRMLIPCSMLKFSDDGGSNSCKVANNLRWILDFIFLNKFLNVFFKL